MRSKLMALLAIPLFVLMTSFVLGSDPTTVVSWNAFPDATEYVVGITDSNGNLSVGSPLLKSLTVPATASPSALLRDVVQNLAAGSYRLQIKAKVGIYETGWSNVANFTWSTLYPGTVTGISLSS